MYSLTSDHLLYSATEVFSMFIGQLVKVVILSDLMGDMVVIKAA